VIHDITERILLEEELHKYRFQLEEMVNERTLEVLVANKKLNQEIQERKKAELAILESEKKVRNIIENPGKGLTWWMRRVRLSSGTVGKKRFTAPGGPWWWGKNLGRSIPA